MSDKIMRYPADDAMYPADPMSKGINVTLLSATPDPLGSLAALCGIYSGRVVRSLAEVTDDQRRQALADMQKTELSGPLEVAQFHFLIDGVTRSLTHQMVRGRSAFYAQESLRFAVKEAFADEVSPPPSITGLKEDDPRRRVWRKALLAAEDAYNALVASGIPAEDARGLLPHVTPTRLHWVVDLRELLHVAGLRLCTQAEFHWRLVMARIAKALRDYSTRGWEDAWQFALIADVLRPVCYQQGRCGFMSAFDRNCKIRDRVEANAAAGRRSDKWHQEYYGKPENIDAINPAEWMADPGAARSR
jgi:flavin-dependent thymidylate synthase